LEKGIHKKAFGRKRKIPEGGPDPVLEKINLTCVPGKIEMKV
jgi:hypothetical protein